MNVWFLQNMNIFSFSPTYLNIFFFRSPLLKSFGFDVSFINWIKVLYEKQESCVLNGGQSTGYFPLERGVRQGDPISAYLFIITIEVFFNMVRKNPKIQGLNILGFNYLLTSYADDTTFFIKDEKSAIEIFNTFDIFSKYSGLVYRVDCFCAPIVRAIF